MIKEKKETRPNIEIQLGRKNRKIFMIVYPFDEEIYIDTKGLPPSATLCAMCDGTPFLVGKCGAKHDHERNFVNIEWAINEWGGPKDLVDALKKRKQMTIDSFAKYRDQLKGEDGNT